MTLDYASLKAQISAHLKAASVRLGAPEGACPELENPKDRSHGDLALPVFPLAKILKKPPLAIAQALAAEAGLPP